MLQRLAYALWIQSVMSNAEGSLLLQDGMPRRVSLATVVGDDAMQSQPP